MQNKDNLIEIETQKVYELISKKRKDKSPFIVAIDGNALSGKTTITNNLKKYLDITIIHLDDYYLKKEKQTKYSNQGRLFNIDEQRLIKEIIVPILNGAKSVYYQKFSCQKQKIISTDLLKVEEVIIIEGTYSLDAQLLPYYDLKLFFEIDKNTQVARIKDREKNNAENFIDKWVKNEEIYFLENNTKKIVDDIITCQ